MSAFRTMTITFARNVTEKGGDFHEITVDDTYAGRLEHTLDAFENAGYEVVSVLIDGYDFSADMWEEHIGHASNVPLLFDALCADSYSADIICAFITVMDCADVENWADSIYISGIDHETVVRGWAYVFNKMYSNVSKAFREEYAETDPFPSWMAIDWEGTLDNIASENSSSVVEFFGTVYYFG